MPKLTKLSKCGHGKATSEVGQGYLQPQGPAGNCNVLYPYEASRTQIRG